MMTLDPVGQFVKNVFDKLAIQGKGDDWSASQLANAIVRAMNGPSQPPPTPILDDANLDVASNNALIHEMLRRGFAVMKLPESGAPEALKD